MLNLKELLNEEQIKPCEALEGPVMVLAGAGSGKTRVLTYRIANLIDKGVDPYHILAITYTNKAAKEMKERVEAVTGCGDVFISTFHSMCVRILRPNISLLGVKYNPNFTIYDEEDSEKIIADIVKNGNYVALEEIKSFCKNCKNHISHAKSHGLNADQYAKYITYYDNKNAILEVFEKYNNVLENNNAVDFDDLLMLTIRLFKEHHEVLEAYQERFQYIHVDEFQDTNKVQYTILKLLGSKYQNVFVVGDDDQSIYGWRGAEYKNVRKFTEEFLGCRLYKLQRNYRSSGKILEVANRVIAYNQNRLGKELWTENPQGAPVEIKSFGNERAEAEFILNQLTMFKRNYGYSYKDMAVLVRTTTITKPLEENLLLYNIPYRLIGGKKFYERKEIKDFLAYLHVITNPNDEVNLLRIINVPKRGIGETAVAALKAECVKKGLSLKEGLMQLDRLELKPLVMKKLSPFASLLIDFDNKINMPMADYVDHVFYEIGFENMYDISKEEDEARLNNLNELLRSIKEFNKTNPTLTISDYLQSVTLMTSEEESQNLTDCVTVATVHGVKGLEFKCVFVIGLEEGIFPSYRSTNTPDEIEEERRIFYVAVTRAKERLFLTYANSRFRFGSTSYSMKSIYLTEAMPKAVKQTTQFRSIEDKSKFDFSKVSSITPDFAKKQNTESVEKKDLTIFRVGQKVEHVRFGEGVIMNIFEENADIQFELLGMKKFNLRLAPIKPLD